MLPPALAATALIVGAVQRPDLAEELLYGGAFGYGSGAVTLGSAFAAALWSFSLWFASPWQLLVLFLGKIETERPSDWLMDALARGAFGEDPGAAGPAHPPAVVAAAAAGTVAAGVATSAAIGWLLQDSTWGVASGIGAVVGAGVYEVGRPPRLSAAEAEEIERQWQAFRTWADGALRPSGRCHESEVFKAFRRTPGVACTVDDAGLRDMVRTWNPSVSRTSQGFLRGVSLAPRVDPFTGQVQ